MAKVLVLSGILTFSLHEWLGCKVVTEEDITGNRDYKAVTESDKVKIASAVRNNEFDLIIVMVAKDDEGAGMEKVRAIKQVGDDLCRKIIVVSIFALDEAKNEDYRAIGVARLITTLNIIDCVEQELSLRKAA